MRKTKSSRPTRKEILTGIGYKALEPAAGVPEEVRAAEDRELQDYLVTWVQGMSEHIASYDKTLKARAKKVVGAKEVCAMVEIDPDSEIGALMTELRSTIDPRDLASEGLGPHPHITVRRILDNDFSGLRTYVRSLNPFDITFGPVTFFHANVNSHKAAVLKVDVISPILEEINLAIEQHVNCKPADCDYQPHAIVAYVKPKAARKYAGNNLLAGRTLGVSTLSLRPKDGKPEFLRLIDGPAPWKEDGYNWPGGPRSKREVKPPQRKPAKAHLSRRAGEKQRRGRR